MLLAVGCCRCRHEGGAVCAPTWCPAPETIGGKVGPPWTNFGLHEVAHADPEMQQCNLASALTCVGSMLGI